MDVVQPDKMSVAVHTGELSMPRSVAEAKAAAMGCQCTAGVSRKTDIVVVGEQDLSLVGPDGMSTKQRKAFELRAAGSSIQILDEAQFVALLGRHAVS